MVPEVSIIIPIYNSERYLSNCLESVCAQEAVDIEIICVLNGCTDRSSEILKAAAADESRIKILKLDEANVGKARNMGVLSARGKYLMFVDSDDIIAEGACSKLFALASTNNLDILQGRFSNPKFSFNCSRDLINRKMTGMDFWKKNGSVSPYMWDKIWRRAFFIENKLFNPEGCYFQDTITSYHGMYHAESFMIIDYCFYSYTPVPDSIANRKPTDKHAESYQRIIGLIEVFISEKRLWDEPAVVLSLINHFFIYYGYMTIRQIKKYPIRLPSISSSILAHLPFKRRLLLKNYLLFHIIYPLYIRIRTLKPVAS